MGNDRDRFEKIMQELVELKDTSEMMMDLAYSSLLLNNRYLAEEVLLLEDQIDRLETEFEVNILTALERPEEVKEFLGLLRIGAVTERIADAAAEIAELILRGIKPHPILRMVIEDAEETVERVMISKDSPVVEMTLREAKIAEETGMWVLIIRRDNRWIRPKPDMILKAGDVVIASGYAEGEEDFIKLLEGEKTI